MLSGAAIGEVATAASVANVAGSGSVVAESLTEPISAGDGISALAILIGMVVESVATDASAATANVPVVEEVIDGVEVAALFLIDGLWVTLPAEPSEWRSSLAGPDDWQVIAAFGDLWIKQ